MIVVPLGLISYYKWDSSVNRGSEFGYWGDFNRTSNALSSIPGLTIIRSWGNNDITLEEFSFDFKINDLKGHLFFEDHSPIRNMPRWKAQTLLQERVAHGRNSTNDNGLSCTFHSIDSTCGRMHCTN